MLCPQCIARREQGDHLQRQYIHLCPKCSVEAVWLGAGNIVAPFWRRLPRFFTYPLHPRPLTLVAVFCIVAAMAGNDPGLFGFLLAGLSYCVMLLYSFAALRGTANGDLTPPPLNRDTLFGDVGLVVKQLGIYVILALVFFLSTAQMGIFVGGVVLVVALLGLPAMVILLVTTGSLLQAVNPLMFVPLAVRIGWGYLLMYLFLILLGGAPQALAGRIVAVIPAGMMPWLATAAKFYYMLISYHLMGYVLLQYHMDIGYTIDQENFRESDAAVAVPQALTGDEKILQDVGLMLRSGDVEDAIAQIQRHGASDAMQSLELSTLYMKMLRLKKMGKAMAAHLPVHLGLLATENRKQEALSLYLSPMAQKSDPALPPETRFKMAGWLNETGRTKAALAAYERVAEDAEDGVLPPKAQFRMAQILNDRLMRPDRARDILEDAITRFPDSDMVGQMRAYLTHL